MSTHEFTIICDYPIVDASMSSEYIVSLYEDDNTATDGMIVDMIYEAGCSDCTVFHHKDTLKLQFSREAESLGKAIVSAFEDIRGTSLNVIDLQIVVK